MALQCIVLILVMISFQGNNLATILDGVVEVGPSGIHAILSSVDYGAHVLRFGWSHLSEILALLRFPSLMQRVNLSSLCSTHMCTIST